jgi:Zn-dependent metalloprotease
MDPTTTRLARGPARSAGLTAGLTSALIALVATALPAQAGPAPVGPTAAGPAAALRLPADLVPVTTKVSLLGSHSWYQQRHRGLPVLGGWYVQHLDPAGRITSVGDGREAVPASLPIRPKVSATSATVAATGLLAKRVVTDKAGSRSAAAKSGDGSALVGARLGRSTSQLTVLGGSRARLVWSVTTSAAAGVFRSDVDALTGKVIASTEISKHADGKGRAFLPNAVVTLKNKNLKDNDNQDGPEFAKAYQALKLANLDGKGSLVGKHVGVVAAQGGVVKSSKNAFQYNRSQPGFEQANAYAALDRSQTYIQSLGFSNINNESQDISVNTIPDDNSVYTGNNDLITFGTGGIDDAEDMEVVWHEYGHAIQDDQVKGFGDGDQAAAIGEGFGDYWAMVMSTPVSDGYDPACIMDWDASPGCLRRLDGDKTTDDIVGEEHSDGEIWSRALWDIHQTLGIEKAAKVVLESQFSYAPDTSFAAAATEVVAAAKKLYGASAASAATKAFRARKIL